MPKQKTALDFIKQQEGHGGMSPEALLLHEKQAEDAENMEFRMCEIEKKVDNLDKKVDSLDAKIDEIKKIVIANGSFVASFKEILCNKIFIYLLLSFMAIKFGLPVADLGTFLFK
jgi:hypothetical protein